MAKKKRYRGHYCKICGEVKANEKFSGKGHRNHICKACSKLSVEKRNELVQLRKIEDIEGSGFYLSKKDKDTLKKYKKSQKYSEQVRENASRVLDEYEERFQEMQEAKRLDEEFYDEDYFNNIDEEDDDLPF